MKLIDLVEKHKTVTGNVFTPPGTTVLNYAGVIIKGGSFDCSNAKLASLEGAPEHIGHSFFCKNTSITSLHNIHKHVKYIGNGFYLPHTIESHVLGVMFIKGLKRGIKFDHVLQDDSGNVQKRWQVENIINKHLKGNRNPHDAQQELIEAGLSDYAKI